MRGKDGRKGDEITSTSCAREIPIAVTDRVSFSLN